MKKILIYIWSALLLINLFSCKEDENNNDVTNTGYAKFSKESVVIGSRAGKASATIVWENVEWSVEIEDNNSFISDITPAVGGSLDKSGLSTISFTFTDNNSPSERSLDLYLIDKATNQQEVVTIVQERLPIAKISTDVRYQEVVGFGGMYNPSNWLSPENLIEDDELATMYDSDGQLKYSILRLMIYADKSRWPRDAAGALNAQNMGAIIFACPWSGPDELADSIEVNDKDYRHLPEANYDAYADYIIEYVEYMRDQGVDIYAVSVQNEPDMDFTYWTPEEITNFTANYGAKIRNSGVKLMSPEACGFQPEYTESIFNSTAAFNNTDIVAGHLYQGFTDLSNGYVKARHDFVAGIYPNTLAAAGKTWWMTEHLFGSSTSEVESQVYKEWSYNLEKLALEMHMCMDGYCSAYVYWYLKRFYGMMSDNSEYAFEPEGTILKNGYIMAHYSAYATNTTRVKIDEMTNDVMATAYVSKDKDEVSVVGLNMGESSYQTLIEFPFEISEKNVIETTEDLNMAPLETMITADKKHIIIKVSPRSIFSIKVKN